MVHITLASIWDSMTWFWCACFGSVDLPYRMLALLLASADTIAQPPELAKLVLLTAKCVLCSPWNRNIRLAIVSGQSYQSCLLMLNITGRTLSLQGACQIQDTQSMLGRTPTSYQHQLHTAKTVSYSSASLEKSSSS